MTGSGSAFFVIAESRADRKRLAEDVYKRQNEAYDAPVLKLNPDVKNFYNFKPEDIVLENYKHHEKIPMEVSV